jgi:hypothetical protein
MKPVLKILLLSCLSVSISESAISQAKAVETLLENINKWREGFILLDDGTELNGLLRFDDNSGILSFRDGEVSKALIARSVSGFQFYDEETKQERIFFSFEYNEGDTFSRYYFFELLRKNDRFAVLCKIDPVQVKSTSYGNVGLPTGDGTLYSPGTMYSRTEVHQTETIYFMDKAGEIRPYVRILEKDTRGLFGDSRRSRNKFVDKKLLSYHTGDYYPQLENFAKDNGLDFRIKSDLLKGLDFYFDLIKMR